MLKCYYYEMKNNSTKLICSIAGETISDVSGKLILAKENGADLAEVRLDLLVDEIKNDKLAILFENSPIDLIVTCRTVCEGGKFSNSKKQDRILLLEFAAQFKKVKYIDCELDIVEEINITKTKIASAHLLEKTNLKNIVNKLDELNKSTGDISKLAFVSNSAFDAISALKLLRENQKQAILIAMNQAGMVSRIACKKIESFGSFFSLNNNAKTAAGQVSLKQAKELYHWSEINDETKLFGIVGAPVTHSQSPAIHNKSFAEVGYNGLYSFLHTPAGYDEFSNLADSIVENSWLDFRGLSVTIPHKENAIRWLGEENCDPLTVKIGAVNTITFTEGKPFGTNTDCPAALEALTEKMQISASQLSGMKVAVLGAGGVARAIIAGLVAHNTDVTILNRTIGKADNLAREFSCSFEHLDKFASLTPEVIINCTPVGMTPNVDQSPIASLPSSVKVVFDTIYNPLETKLLKIAKAADCICVSGLDMFVKQAALQFETWTGKPAPADLMKNIVKSNLKL